MIKPEMDFKKACADCMYFGEENFCIRKQKKVHESECCLHYVKFCDRHSLEEIIKLMADVFEDK